MKRILLLMMTVVAMSLTTTAYSQIRFGVKGGANFSSIPLSGTEIKSAQMTSYHAGVMAELEVPVLPLSIEADLLLSQRGSLLEDGKVSELFKSNHIDLPIYAKLWFLDFSAMRFFAQAGPYFSYRLSSNVNDIVGSFDKLGDLDAKRFGFGLNLGLGVELLKYFQLSAQYSAALGNDYEYKGVVAAASDFKKTKEKLFSVSLGIVF